MTMRKLPLGGAWEPLPINPFENLFDSNYLTLLQGTSTRVMFTFFAPVSGVLDEIEFQMDASGANSATTLKVSFQDLDSNDLPDGVADQYRIIEVGDFLSWVAPGLMTSDGTDGGTKRTVTRGQKLACVIEFDTPNTGDNISIGSLLLSDDTTRRGPGGGGNYVGGSWSRVNIVTSAALRYEGTVYYSMPELVPANLFSPAGFNSGSEPDEVGMQFSFQAPVRIGGASFCIFPSTGSVPFNVVVYDETGSELETVSVKSYTAIAPNGSYSYWTVKFSQDIYVPANVSYKITVKPTSASNISLMEMYMENTTIANQLYGYLDNGSNQYNWMHIERFDENDPFEPTDTVIPLISLNITGSDMDAGGATDDWTGDA